MHPASYTAPCELNFTLWATLHPMSYAPPHWAELYSNKMYRNPTELPCTLLSTSTQPPSYWAMLQPIKLCCTFWSMLHLTKLCCTLQSYAVPYRAMLHLTELCCTSQSYAAPHRATLHPTKLCCTPRSYLTPGELRSTLLSYPTPCELRCNLLSYAVPHRASLYPTELPNNLWAGLDPTELRCTPLSYGAQTLKNEIMNDNLMRKYPWSEVLDKL